MLDIIRYVTTQRLAALLQSTFAIATLVAAIVPAASAYQESEKKPSAVKSVVDKIGEKAVEFILNNLFRKEDLGVRETVVKFAKEEAEKWGIKFLADDERLRQLVDVFFALGSEWNVFWEALGKPTTAGPDDEKALVEGERRRLAAARRLRPFLESELRKADERLRGLEEKRDCQRRRTEGLRSALQTISAERTRLGDERGEIDRQRSQVESARAQLSESVRRERDALRNEEKSFDNNPEVKAYTSERTFYSNYFKQASIGSLPALREAAPRHLAHLEATGELWDDFPISDHHLWKTIADNINRQHRRVQELRKPLDERISSVKKGEDSERARLDEWSAKLSQQVGRYQSATRDLEVRSRRLERAERELDETTDQTTNRSQSDLSSARIQRRLLAELLSLSQVTPTGRFSLLIPSSQLELRPSVNPFDTVGPSVGPAKLPAAAGRNPFDP
jgi:hypothetical protein